MPVSRSSGCGECVVGDEVELVSEAASASRADDPRRERIAWLRQLIVERFGPHVLLDPACLALDADCVRPAMPPGSARSPRFLSTDLLGLDLVLGGGLPRGRLIELAGPPYSGKRTLAGWFVRAVQRSGGWVAYLDAAHSVDFDRLYHWGVAVLDLLVALPQSVTEALELARFLVLSGALDLVVLDLPPHLARRPELDRGLRQLRPLLRGLPAAFVVVRDRVDTHALAAAQVRLRVEPIAQLVRPGLLAAHALPESLRVRVHVERSPLWPPRDPPVPIELCLREGVRVALERIDLGLALGVVRLHPLGLVFAETILGRTRETAAARLQDDPSLRSRVEEEIRACWLSSDRSLAARTAP
ncbi:recombinase A [Thermomicrobium sp. 4228-Ro]|uniref:recombinase A n=1 Tax=Thermomicrobium sp. 4228-Ro TaxID=2993937 RepID=UPI0022487742|nr:recombinase A [Thermomicrobium sp. 4228-Ro]MCX2728460.1 recombinase A [Thermomicrobium sp. 4228-Ro]